MLHHATNVNGLRRDKRGLKRSGNQLSRWLTLPPEASLSVCFIFVPSLNRPDGVMSREDILAQAEDLAVALVD